MAWTLSPQAQRASDRIVRIPYDGGGPFDRAQCATSPMPHTAKLARILRVAFPWLSARTAIDSTYGPERCAPMQNGEMSLHDVGRALDCMVPVRSGAEGESLANFLVENAVRFGVQLVIWNRSVWQPSIPRDATGRYARFAPYTGDSPHEDHVHVEVSLAPGPGLIDVGEAPPIVPPETPATSPAAVPGHSGWFVAGIGAAIGGVLTWALWPRHRRRRR